MLASIGTALAENKVARHAENKVARHIARQQRAVQPSF